MSDGGLDRIVLRHARPLAALLRRIADDLEAAAPLPSGVVVFYADGRLSVANVTVKDDQAPFGASIQLFNARGNPIDPDDTPSWASSDESVLTVDAADDGRSAQVTVVGKVGASLVTVTSHDAESDEDVVMTGTVTVEPSQVAVRGEVSFTPSA